MPPLPAVNEVLRVAFTMTDDSDVDVVSRLYFEYSGTAPTNAQLNTFATSCASAWNTSLAPLHSSNVSLTKVEIEDLTTTGSALGVWTGTHAGTRTGGRLPGNVAALINYAIARRYRGGKPRSYWPMGTQSDVLTAQTWGSSFVTAVGTDYAAFLAAILALTWTGATISNQVNVSYYEGFTTFTTPSGRVKNLSKLRTGGPQVDSITSFALNGKFGSQRRRVAA